tara:strand:- start:338 stop:982 length:645 start_codon:yes stop_codon:yes gene_type:complete
MRAGALRNRVTIQALGSTYDDYGDLSNSWTTGDTVWASIFPVGGTEVDIAKEMVGVVTHVVKMRYRSNVPVAASGARIEIYNHALLDAGDTLSIVDGNGLTHEYIADTDFTVETSGTITAANLTAAINEDGSFSATQDTKYVDIDQIIEGSAGNDDISITGYGWTITTGMTGGADGLTQENRLLYGTQVLQIESVLNWQERNVFLELLCKEVTI